MRTPKLGPAPKLCSSEHRSIVKTQARDIGLNHMCLCMHACMQMTKSAEVTVPLYYGSIYAPQVTNTYIHIHILTHTYIHIHTYAI